MVQTTNYRFKLREWLNKHNAESKRLVINILIKTSGQSRYTIRRIMYMKRDDSSYVRKETIEAICKILDKDTSDFEYPTSNK